MQFSAKRGLRRTAGDRLCTLVKRRELIPPFVEQSPMDAELLRQRHDVVARLQSLDGHSPEFFRPPTHSSFSHWQFLSLPVCLNELSQIWGSVHGALFARFVQKTEGKRDKATVFLTVAFFNESGGQRHVQNSHTLDNRPDIERDGIRNGVASLAL